MAGRGAVAEVEPSAVARRWAIRRTGRRMAIPSATIRCQRRRFRLPRRRAKCAAAPRGPPTMPRQFTPARRRATLPRHHPGRLPTVPRRGSPRPATTCGPAVSGRRTPQPATPQFYIRPPDNRCCAASRRKRQSPRCRTTSIPQVPCRLSARSLRLSNGRATARSRTIRCAASKRTDSGRCSHPAGADR